MRVGGEIARTHQLFMKSFLGLPLSPPQVHGFPGNSRELVERRDLAALAIFSAIRDKNTEIETATVPVTSDGTFAIQ
jgi:hypothetical protein